MLDQNRKQSNKKMWQYDADHDVLYISIGDPVPSYSDEDSIKGVFIRRAFEDNRVTGATIIDYSKRNKQVLMGVLPFKINLEKIKV